MPGSAVAIDLLEPLDILSDLSSKVSFDEMLLQFITDFVQFLFGKSLDLLVHLDSDSGKHLIRKGFPHSVDIGESDLDMFSIRECDSSDSCHASYKRLMV